MEKESDNKKISTIITGSFGVGKTSIFNRLIYDVFDSRYDSTVGLRINSKKMILRDDFFVELVIWDVAGEVDQNKVPAAYFKDKDFITYVFDLHHPVAPKRLPADIDYLKKHYPDLPIKLVGNKVDLLNEIEVSQIVKHLQPLELDAIISAKTGQEVEASFVRFVFEFY